MAKQEHLVILKQGVETWNRWRQEHFDIRPDLRSADLNNANLIGANLREVDLSNADLTGAGLNNANLSQADLTGAVLTGAVLSNADLSEATLSNADLSEAELFGADLFGATLLRARLRRANLSEAFLSGALLRGKYLREGFIVAYHRETYWGDYRRDYLERANLLREVYFSKVDLSEADLSEAKLLRASLNNANLRGANLRGADLRGADLTGAVLSNANLRGADLSEATLFGADLSEADLSEATLFGAVLVDTNLSGAILTWCSIYGVSAWSVKLEGAIQDDLVITPSNEPTITVDNLEVAQFIYLLLNHKKLRDVFNAVTERGVLILGRFGGGGLEVLQAIAAKLREEKYLPIIFDFERPQDRNYTETVKTLAGLSRFIIADLSGPSVPQELYATVPHLKIPFVPIIEAGRRPFSMIVDLLEYPWVVRPPVTFATTEELLEQMPAKVIAPAEEKHQARQKLFDELFNEA